MALQHLRSSTAHKRPIPTVMSAGQIAINTNETSPGLFVKDSNGDLVKIGPIHIGTDAPNSSPASVAATALVTGTVYQILTVGTSDFTLVGASANTVGTIFTATGTTTGTGTVSGQQGVEKGEQWLDTTGGEYTLKIYDGTSWQVTTGGLLEPADIGVTVQGYDADTTKNDVANTFTAEQTFNAGVSVDGAYEQVAETVAALDIDLSTGNYFTKTISANSTFTFSNPPASGTVGSFTLELTHTSGTVTWPSSVKFNSDTAPTLTTGKTHLFFFVTDDGGTRYRGAALVDYVN